MYWFLIAIVVVIALIAVVLVPHNLRVRRARQAFRRLPPEIIEKVFAALERAAAGRKAVTFLRPMHDTPCDDPTASHIGGLPYAERDEIWPVTEAGPDTFLLQVRLDDPGLGKCWQARLIEVFLVFDLEQTVRSYAAPQREAYVPLDVAAEPVACVPLRHIQVPQYEDAGEEATSWSEQFVNGIPEVGLLLEPFSQDVEGLLSQILCPQVYGYRVTEADEAFMGGEPVLIQNPHDPVCDACGATMRFLFQFGEFIPDMQLADGGVCYVYGCDRHPDRCKAYVDSH